MPRNRFDQASRSAAKLDAVGFLCWLLRETPATLPFPGEPDRPCDTIAWLGDPDPAIHLLDPHPGDAIIASSPPSARAVRLRTDTAASVPGE
jgi:hypothetical protein